MTRIVAAVGVLLLFPGVSGAQGAAQLEKARAELVQIERDWCSALMKKDPAALNRILADDYQAVGSRGKPSDKAGDLADTKGSDTLSACVDDNVKVRVYGDTAVVMAHGVRTGTFKGTP